MEEQKEGREGCEGKEGTGKRAEEKKYVFIESFFFSSI